ncbi:MAG TPA: energy transducer TonB [Flavisolibacter sp.]|nr:energy transducer TonB [Flavisolibacter sp.]
MSESPGNNIYSAKDIERYHKGLMTARERHALEKAALDDPFLADAIEGYSFTTTPQEDIEEIRRRVFANNNSSKALLYFKKNSWMKIAALFLIVAGGGWLIINSVNNKKEISQATPTSIKSAPSTPPVNLPDTSRSKDIPVSSPSELPIESAKTIQPARRKANKFNADHKTRVNNNQESPALATQAKPVAGAPSLTMAESTSVAAMSARQKEAINNTAAARSRSFKAADSSPAYVNKPVKDSSLPPGDTIKNFNVVLQPDKANNDIEIVQLKSKHPVVARPSPKFETLEPAEGWSQFNDYVAENIKEPNTFKEKPGTGEVELAFDIDKDGNPINITVVSSQCASCNKKAIELLKQGPTWKNIKSKKGKLTFHF